MSIEQQLTVINDKEENSASSQTTQYDAKHYYENRQRKFKAENDRDRKELADIKRMISREKINREILGTVNWEPPAHIKHRIRLLELRIHAFSTMKRANGLDIEDLWRKPRLKAVGPPQSILLKDTPESRATAGFVHRNFKNPTIQELADAGVIPVGRMVKLHAPKNRRGKRGGRKHRLRQTKKKLKQLG